MRNSHVTDLVDDFVHDLLGPAESAQVEQHCAGCASCKRALDKARQRLTHMQTTPVVEPPADLVPRTMRRVEADEQRRSVWRKRYALGTLTALAAAVLVLLGAHIWVANLRPSNYDLVLLGQNNLLAGSNASLRVRVMDRASNRAVAKVPVKVNLIAAGGQATTLAEFTTDDQGAGSPRVEVPDWVEGSYQLQVIASPGWSRETMTRPVTLKRSWKLMLSSDKPVYQPGQTIQLRALALRRPDLKPVGEQDAVFTLVDPKGNILFKHRQATSKFGITSAECELASEVTEGAYTVACQIGDTKSQMAVEIKRYVLPKFKLDVTPDKRFYEPGEPVKLAIDARYFFGKPVAKGRVAVKVSTPAAGEKVLETLEGNTDENGKLELTFELPREFVGTEQNSGDAQVTFAATITDTAEQKQDRLVSRLVTRTPVRVTAIPEAGKLVRSQPNTVYLLVTKADGSAVPGAKISVMGTDTEKTLTADAQGAASFTVTPTTDDVSWTIRVNSKDGNARKHVQMTCGQNVGDYLVRTDRAAYKSGQTMTLTVLGSGIEPVFVDFIKDGQTLNSETVAVSGDRGEHTFDLPADLFGTVEMLAYRFDPASGLPVRKRRILYISPPDSLKIHATLDKAEYRPGRTAKLNLSLTDLSGKPTPGAISLVAVDEAVFSVMAQRPGMEQVFYTLDEELLKPVYAIYPWMPGEEPSVQREQAVFASTSEQIDQPASGRVMSKRSGSATAEELQPQSRHTLAANTFPENERRINQLRAERMESIYTGWVLTILSALVLGYAGLWVFLPVGKVLQLHGGGAFLILALLVGVIILANVSPRVARTFDMVGGSFMAGEAMPQSEAVVRQRGRDKAKSDDFRRPILPGGGPEARFRLHLDPDDVTHSSKSMTDSDVAAPRVRSYFPETLLWKPQLITDDNGKLPPLPIDLADSITSWRITLSAVGGDGQLGALQMPMKVFQPFFVDLNLPVSLTRGDEVGMPVVVYNYLDRPQSVKLTLSAGTWFSLTGKAEQTLELKPGEVRSTRYTIKVNTVGLHKLRVTAIGGEVSDAIEREIEVVPDGRRVEVAHSGSLDRERAHMLNVPADAIEGSVKAFVKLYPSSFSQLVEGLDNIFRMPSGCFEQTSSTTYPNILALQYLKHTNQRSPKIEAKARQYIHLGYQRLVGFEVQGGGFEWFGNPPAHQTLTAYGLMQFVDMAKVHDVDPALIDRTRRWLMAKRKPDGSWEPEQRQLHENIAGGDAALAKLATTAYIALAVFGDGPLPQEAQVTLDYLLTRQPKDIDSVHVLALVCNALLVLNRDGKDAADYLRELLARRKQSDDGKLTWWEPPAGSRMMFHGGGDTAKIETTALACLALLKSDQAMHARPALSWLVTKKDASGTWHSTQATVLSLKALVAGTGKPLGGDSERIIKVSVGEQTQTITLPADQAEVMKLLDVSKFLKPGDNEVSIFEKSKTAAGYQVVFRYHVPDAAKADKSEPLSIDIAYDRNDLALGETVKATATVTNRMTGTAPMVMLDLPVPPGFAPETGAFAKLVSEGTIAKYQVQARRVLVYLRALQPGKPLVLSYSLRATMPVKATADAARVYEYYDPQKQGTSPARQFTVRAKE